MRGNKVCTLGVQFIELFPLEILHPMRNFVLTPPKQMENKLLRLERNYNGKKVSDSRTFFCLHSCLTSLKSEKNYNFFPLKTVMTSFYYLYMVTTELLFFKTIKYMELRQRPNFSILICDMLIVISYNWSISIRI